MALQPPTNPHITEKTFTAYTPTQATTYATTRLNYHPSVYNHILSHHTSTSGKLDTHLDIGCGPGPATRSLSSHFTHSIGIDPSPALLDVAKSLTPDGSSITYHESTASTFTPDPINPASVDLITVANAAHWFPHMHAFYRHAAVALRPGGTLAIWGGGNLSPDPTLENAAKIKDVIDAFIEGDVREYVTEGNLMVHNAYAGLKMPWDNDGGKAVRGFDREGYSRKEWGAEDKFHEMRNGEEEAGGLTLPMLEKVMGTLSPVTRWREANPEKVGTEKDILKKLVARIGELLREGGQKAGEERVRGYACAAVLLFKRNDDVVEAVEEAST